MPAIRRISNLTLEHRGGLDPRVCVRFKMNQLPDSTWIDLFKAHSAASVFGVTNMIIVESGVSVEVARPSSAAELATAMDCFIECANLRLRSFPGQAHPQPRPGPAFRPRGGLLGDARPYRFS